MVFGPFNFKQTAKIIVKQNYIDSQFILSEKHQRRATVLMKQLNMQPELDVSMLHTLTFNNGF